MCSTTTKYLRTAIFLYPAIILTNGQSLANELPAFRSSLINTGMDRSDAELIIKDLNIGTSKNGNKLIDLSGCGELDSNVQPLDLRSRRVTAVIVTIGNTCRSGAAGFSTYLYTKTRNNKVRKEIEFTGSDLTPIYKNQSSPPDLKTGGPGFCHQIFRWNNGKYYYLCSEAENVGSCEHVKEAVICRNR